MEPDSPNPPARESAAASDPASAEAHNDLGLAHLVGGDPRAAAGEFSRALELNPDYAKARENLGRAQAAMAATLAVKPRP